MICDICNKNIEEINCLEKEKNQLKARIDDIFLKINESPKEKELDKLIELYKDLLYKYDIVENKQILKKDEKS